MYIEIDNDDDCSDDLYVNYTSKLITMLCIFGNTTVVTSILLGVVDMIW